MRAYRHAGLPPNRRGVGVRARDAAELFGEVLPGLDRTFVQQLGASSRDPAVMAPLLTGSIDERSNLEASSVGNCMRERPVFLQLMHQYDALHKALALKGSGLEPYGLTYASVPQADAVKAAVLEAEVARYTWLCGEHTVSGEILMRRAVSEYLLASTWARLAGSPGMFTAYKAAGVRADRPHPAVLVDPRLHVLRRVGLLRPERAGREPVLPRRG